MRRLVMGPAVAGLVTLSLVAAALVAPAASAYGSAVQFGASATSAPADGTSTITLGFVGYDTVNYRVDFSLSLAKFGTTSSGSGITVFGKDFASTAGMDDIAPNATLTIVAPATAGSATLTVQLVPRAGGIVLTDSVTQFTFTAVSHAPPAPGAPTSTLPSPRAHKVALFKGTASNCTTTQPTGRPNGFAVVKVLATPTTSDASAGTVFVNLQLKKAARHATYDVTIWQATSACGVSSTLKSGAVHTNGRGMGHAHLSVAYVKDATQVWVTVTNQVPNMDAFVTRIARLK